MNIKKEDGTPAPTPQPELESPTADKQQQTGISVRNTNAIFIYSQCEVTDNISCKLLLPSDGARPYILIQC